MMDDAAFGGELRDRAEANGSGTSTSMAEIGSRNGDAALRQRVADRHRGGGFE